eukprot:TRINITY_DN67787_c4_g2_i1.p1 TRINITY_DN67787_c4_g2~~TRINITY_DN67787_c4_g2_i1.p1  ORF type:complete len:1189 (-),score=90.92 TRINITY_DN67787_c4_g2_i1:201-3767(-)
MTETQKGDDSSYVCYSAGSQLHGTGYPSNYIRTTKYTWYTFIPHNMFEQFLKVQYSYFLINMIIALLPDVSPIFPITSILPLIFVLSVAMARDGFENYRRHKADKRANSKQVTVIRSGKKHVITSAQLEVGDFVYMEKGDLFAADIVLLSSALDEGRAYIETANLDGETNIKPKLSPASTMHLNTPSVLHNNEITIKVTCDAPGPSLIKWRGTLEMNSEVKPLGLDNIMFRGCKLRNTKWIYGMVVYAGVDTKMMRNLKKKPPKFSGLDRKLNKLIIALVIVQQIIIFILALCSVLWKNGPGQDSPFLVHFASEWGSVRTFIQNYLTFFVLLSFMMPISLFVSMELCKGCQAKFMEWDIWMQAGGRGMKAKTSNLNEELSQIRYIFTDKTGTLTENEMRFYRCSILGFSHNEIQNKGAIQTHLKNHGRYHETIAEFMKVLAVCHTVVISTDDKTGERRYEGQSPDEEALVNAARDNGFELMSVSSTTMVVNMLGKETTYTLLATFEFTSDRKRMSVVCQLENGTKVLLCKGADSAILPRISKVTAEDSKWYNHTISELDAMAKEGLRTLVVAMRVISDKEWEEWKPIWDKANLSLADREEEVADACALMEKDLRLLGATGIEDRLQDKVPETINYFLQAGTVIWMLTGDKRETAVNIAASSRLVDIENGLIHHLDAPTAESYKEVKVQLDDLEAKIRDAKDRRKTVTLVIDGITLGIVLEKYEQQFVTIGLQVGSAICCRVTPLQKAKVVGLFQKRGFTALSVGDGANDVSMIQQAKVGIGIMGNEGAQAELASDYAIPKFRHLLRLVAVHGRFSLVRNAMLIQYSFYKNLVLALIQVYFAVHNGFSGQTLFDSWVMTLFNITFTALPPLVSGIFEKDLHDEVIERNPQLFIDLSRGQNFSVLTLVGWGVAAIYHSMAIFFLTSATFAQDDALGHKTSGIWTQGSIGMTLVIMVVLAKSALHTRHFTWIPTTALVLSLLGYFLMIIVYSAPVIFFGVGNYYSVAFELLSSAKFYLWMILFIPGMLMPDFALLYIQRAFYPTLRNKLQSYYHRTQSRQHRVIVPTTSSTGSTPAGASLNNTTSNNPGTPLRTPPRTGFEDPASPETPYTTRSSAALLTPETKRAQNLDYATPIEKWKTQNNNQLTPGSTNPNKITEDTESARSVSPAPVVEFSTTNTSVNLANYESGAE